MRAISAGLFQLMKQRSTTFSNTWLVTRADGLQFGFTSHDREFVYDGVTYYPENGIAGDAFQTKNDFSANNSSAKVVFSVNITEEDVRGGKFDYADVQAFWIDPNNIDLGIVPIQRGNIGEITTVNNEFTAELRSILDALQQPYGLQYNLECNARLGDSRCGVPMTPPTWAAGVTWCSEITGDARYGGVVKPSVYNGLWYLCTAGQLTTTLAFETGTSYAGLGQDPFVGTGYNPFSTLAGGNPLMTVLIAELFTAAMSAFPTTPGTSGFVYVNVGGGQTGTTEPVWPTTVGGTVTDGQLTWTAIPAKIVNGTVSGVINQCQFQDNSLTAASEIYQYGWMQWTSGNNSGRIIEVRDHVTGPPAQVTILETMPYPIEIGDTYQISVGCNHNRAACGNEFNNILNMRGFPDMPTEDRVLATPNFSTNNSDASFVNPSTGGKKG